MIRMFLYIQKVRASHVSVAIRLPDPNRLRINNGFHRGRATLHSIEKHRTMDILEMSAHTRWRAENSAAVWPAQDHFDTVVALTPCRLLWFVQFSNSRSRPALRCTIEPSSKRRDVSDLS
jgi:hypothetical protein